MSGMVTCGHCGTRAVPLDGRCPACRHRLTAETNHGPHRFQDTRPLKSGSSSWKIGDAFTLAWSICRTVSGVVVFFVVANIGYGFLSIFALAAVPWDGNLGAMTSREWNLIIGGIVVTVAYGWIGLGFLKLLLDAGRSRSYSIERLFEVTIGEWCRAGVVGISLFAICLPGFLLCIPGLYLMAALGLAVILLLDGKAYLFDAIGKSWEMTSGCRWRIVGATILVGLMALPGSIVMRVANYAIDIDRGVLQIPYIFWLIGKAAEQFAFLFHSIMAVAIYLIISETLGESEGESTGANGGLEARSIEGE